MSPGEDHLLLFSECFPMVMSSEKVIAGKLEGAELFDHYEGDRLAGFAAASGNTLLLLCVSPGFRGRGIGSLLLERAEQAVRDKGYDRIVLGRSERDLFWGALIDTLSHRFFENRGYSAKNGCLSMFLFAEEYSYDDFLSGRPVREGVCFRISKGTAAPEVLEAVRRVEPKWVKFYENASGLTVITAEVSGKTAGFVLADTDARTIITEDDGKTGLLGYVGVVPEERNKGTGLGMIAFAADYMISEGCTEIFINYTSLDTWYSKLGFEEYLWYWMGEKIF